MNARLFTAAFIVALSVALMLHGLAQAQEAPAAPPAEPAEAAPSEVVAEAAPAEAASAEPAPTPADAAAPAAETAPEGAVGAAPADDQRILSLYDMLQAGGVILWIIIGLSVLTLILAIYLFLTITTSREVPANFLKRALVQIRAGDLRGAYQMCEGRDELLARVLRAGLKMYGHDRYVIQDAMESEGERGASALWQKVSYLNNIGVIAPLLGLLGTVWGMIGAFSVLALDDAQTKGMEMAYAVAQAMITTAAGLVLAIPAMVLYFYLRGRVLKIIAEVEANASEVIELLTRRTES